MVREIDDTVYLLGRLYRVKALVYTGSVPVGKIVYAAKELCSSIFTIFGGLALTVSLFAIKVPDDADTLTLLNNPLVVLGVIIVMLIENHLDGYCFCVIGIIV